MIGIILFSSGKFQMRQTFKEHLFSFRKYSKLEPLYFDVEDEIPVYLTWINFDYIILHYSFLANERFLENPSRWTNKINRVKQMSGIKVALPQDEYVYTNRLCDFFNDIKLSILGTIHHNDNDLKKVYLDKLIKKPKVLKLLTGYIDDNNIDKYKGKPLSERTIDVGYRARKLPPYLGEFAQTKEQITNYFIPLLEDKSFQIDIKNTLHQNENTKFGTDWIDFLKSVKFILGCEGGASLLDSDGSIKRKVEDYLNKNPEADFSTIKRLFFEKEDNNLSLFALGPRNIEAILTCTLQILVEGNYNGVLIPGLHYIPINKDFSNLDEILNLVSDLKYCENFVVKARENLLGNKDLMYSNFVCLIDEEIQKLATLKSDERVRIKFLLNTAFTIRNSSIKFKQYLKFRIKNLLMKFKFLILE